ncbi:hypothetical protein B0H10DRAFT_1970818 [Mycena sp. CBHHK59/15]|nr:hypothetical protein B0H10DRAFT_1970818 [Mycena sp. CBHHK59/15]
MCTIVRYDVFVFLLVHPVSDRQTLQHQNEVAIPQRPVLDNILSGSHARRFLAEYEQMFLNVEAKIKDAEANLLLLRYERATAERELKETFDQNLCSFSPVCLLCDNTWLLILEHLIHDLTYTRDTTPYSRNPALLLSHTCQRWADICANAQSSVWPAIDLTGLHTVSNYQVQLRML